MKHSLLLNLIWCAVAIGAYVLGSQRSPETASVSKATPRVHASSSSSSSTSTAPPDASGVDRPVWLQALRDQAGNISPDRMVEAITAALRDTDPVQSMLAFTQLLKELTPENAPAAFKAVRDLSTGRESMRYLTMLGFAWGEKDGPGALAAMSKLGGWESGMSKSSALSGWASRDPQGAIRYMAELKAGAKTDGETEASAERGRGRGSWSDEGFLERGIISGLVRNNTEEAIKYLMTLKEDQRPELLSTITSQKLKEGTAAASTWALSLTDEKLRASALETISHQYLRQDSKAAMAWAESIASQSGSSQAVGEIAESLGRKNPAEAATWALSLPAGESQKEALREVYRDWTRADPTAASTQLSQMASGPGKDAAIQIFSTSLARENPKDALTWASTITNPDERIKAQADVARAWNRSAPAEALPWITQNLPQDIQAKVLAPSTDSNDGRGGRTRGRLNP